MTEGSTSIRRGERPAAPRTLADLPPPAALIFDLDGTLVDSVRLRIEAWRRALGEKGVHVPPDEVSAYIGSDGRWLADELARKRGIEFDPDTLDWLDRRSGAIYDELNSSPRPLPGATELLTALEDSRLIFAIATSSLPGQIAVSLESLRLPSAPPITDGSHVERAKPEPDLLLTAASQLGVPPAGCWYVGDSRWDMIASSRAGMSGIGVTTGAIDAESLLGAGAAVAVHSLMLILTELRLRGLVQ